MEYYAIYESGNFVGLTESPLAALTLGDSFEKVGENTARYLVRITEDYRKFIEEVSDGTRPSPRFAPLPVPQSLPNP